MILEVLGHGGPVLTHARHAEMRLEVPRFRGVGGAAREKLSQHAQILSLQNSDQVGLQKFTTLDDGTYLECWSIYMGTPSPVCANWIEKQFRSVQTDSEGNETVKVIKVDPYGNNICSATMRGDHWRQRHDALKHVVQSICHWSRFPVDVEVLNIFAPYIDRLNYMRSGWDERKRQVMIPDIFFPTISKMGDIKTMTCCKSHYPPCRFRRAVENDAVRVRQDKVDAEYKRKARKIDENFNNHPVNSARPGPVGLKLTSFGRVKGFACGAFGEGSPDMHKLCNKLADVAASTRFMEMGARSLKTAKSRASRYVYDRTEHLALK